ncbi:MFS transporter [Corynebacterium cystitidis]|uniref:MFS transporter, UMF1 family n=1 Tax=Corynebacterium cystitidis DSM 20524 TaxID=1121357 RepID=A0A1H9W975_9CORY|nr:MFS transporter [Corynebacterium cystitidis]WJY83263.1 Vacuole effluxer Atg22 like protein [Corynebacterium cystitidis DSM 20524]SES30341.1 MFS transporter, UMF1 family [Corynebacterium cystitidis DSM 20524]SNV64152.1 major facilitator superfamily permease [Corynebacterium cystitidis]
MSQPASSPTPSDTNSASANSASGAQPSASPAIPGQRTDRLSVAAWASWDAGSAAFHAVLVTFIFSVDLVDDVGTTVDSALKPSQWYSLSMAAAGIVIALVTPVMGQRADQKGTRKQAVIVWTLWTIAAMAGLYFVKNTAPEYFWLGLVLIACSSVTIQFAEVSYFAMLNQVSTEHTVGRVSGIGWAAGYVGGIAVLLLSYILFQSGSGDTRGILRITTDEGLNTRTVAIFAAAWFLVCALPLFIRVPEVPTQNDTFNDSFLASYRRLFRDLKTLWRTNKNGVFFLAASAIFRDGLSGVFAFGAILAVTVYGLSTSEVLLFGVAANVVAALGATVGGFLDDKVGPKAVILTSLVIMILAGFTLLFASGALAFWVLGLILCLFVGPAQSSSRSFVARVTPPGHEGQMFGLYTTAGRAVSWLTPLLFATFVGISGSDDRAGIIGIVMVLLIGVILIIRVRDPHRNPGPKSKPGQRK